MIMIPGNQIELGDSSFVLMKLNRITKRLEVVASEDLDVARFPMRVLFFLSQLSVEIVKTAQMKEEENASRIIPGNGLKV